MKPQLLRVQNFAVSRDGFGAGTGQSLERPFGDADPARLMSWDQAVPENLNAESAGGEALIFFAFQYLNLFFENYRMYLLRS